MAKELEFGLFVVSKSGEDVGRCAAIINKKFQAEKQVGVGFIGFFAAAEGCGQEVAEMIEQAEHWLNERVKEIPKTSVGKFDKKEIRRLHSEGKL
jgi:non-ribosomal peptide synthetase component E (peptide arylation enzyme)